MPDLIQDTIVVPPSSVLPGASPTRTFKDADGKHYSGTVPVALDGTPLGTVLTELALAVDDLATSANQVIDQDKLDAIKTAVDDVTSALASVPVTNINLDATLSSLKTAIDAITSALASVPVTNANLDAKLSDIKAKTDNLDVALSTRTKAADQQHTIIDSIPSVVVTNSNLDVALSTRTKPSDTQTVSGSVTAVVTNLDVALSTRTKPADQQHAIIDSGSCAITATLSAKQSYGSYTALTVTNLQSLANSATAGWQSDVIDNRTTKAQDYRIAVKLTTANTAPAAPSCMYVFICPAMHTGAAWVMSDQGTTTLPTGVEGTTTISATTHNLKFLGALAYTAQQQICQASFCLSDAVGAAMPEGFSIIIINNSGAALSTGCVVAIEAITGSLS